MKITVTLSANAGVALDIGGRRIWVDALHEQKEEAYSTLTPQLQGQMLLCPEFSDPEFILYTHCHGDHYSEKLTGFALQRWPDARVIAPEGRFGCLEGESVCFESRGLTLRFLKLPHEGERYRDVLHYGILISYCGCNVLIPGDCAVADEALTAAIGDTKMHLALLDFPWVGLRKGREYLQKHFATSKVALVHLPFAQDDSHNYRKAAKRSADALGNILDIDLLMEPLQKLEFEV